MFKGCTSVQTFPDISNWPNEAQNTAF
jgi:hypothetical protein